MNLDTGETIEDIDPSVADEIDSSLSVAGLQESIDLSDPETALAAVETMSKVFGDNQELVAYGIWKLKQNPAFQLYEKFWNGIPALVQKLMYQSSQNNMIRTMVHAGLLEVKGVDRGDMGDMVGKDVKKAKVAGVALRIVAMVDKRLVMLQPIIGPLSELAQRSPVAVLEVGDMVRDPEFMASISNPRVRARTQIADVYSRQEAVG